MNRLNFSGYMLGISAAALLAGCGGLQPPNAAPGVMSENQPIAIHVDRSGSWMLPEAASENLLYVSDGNLGIFVFTYPMLKLVGQLTRGFTSPDGMCSDRAGNVFITDTQTYHILEFAHGGTTPIGELSGPPSLDFRPSDCSIDPVTGNLAATSAESAALLIFPKAQGNGTVYVVPKGALFYCAYDDKGDLFADEIYSRLGTVYIAELPKGSSNFRLVKLVGPIQQALAMKWDGRYLAIDDSKRNIVYRMRVSGSKAFSVGEVPTNGAKYIYAIWIRPHTLIGADIYGADTGFWAYPAGGPMLKEIIGLFSSPSGVTISASP